MKLRDVLQTAADTINNAHARHKMGTVVNWKELGKAHDLLLAARDEIENAPWVVKCEDRRVAGWWEATLPSERNGECSKCTHRARLVDIEELGGNNGTR